MTRRWHFAALLLVTIAVGCRKPAAASDRSQGDGAQEGSKAAGPPPPAAGAATAESTPASSSASSAGSASVSAPASTPVKPVPAQLPDVLATVNGERVERW